MKKVIIIGGGPAGLSAGLELLKDPDIDCTIYEMDSVVGGLSKTLEYKGNKIDIGPHRFFSKVNSVVDYWKKFDENLLIKNRQTRIYYDKKFFDYPVKLNFKTLFNLGPIKLFKIIASYLKSVLFPIKNGTTLEDFYINRFGKELYNIFFKDYTKKVWGVDCSEIPDDWGAQRVKELSLSKTIKNAITSLFGNSNTSRKDFDASLAEHFYYPACGAGMMWNEFAKEIQNSGGKIFTNKEVVSIKMNGNKIDEVFIKDLTSGEITSESADYFISSMPVKNLIMSMNNVPDSISSIANELKYRDLIMLGFLFKKFKNEPIFDHWTYLQEKDIKASRMEIYNNFSIDMLKDKNTIWLGLEYCCNKGDDFWSKDNQEIIDIGLQELLKMGFFEQNDLLDVTVYRFDNVYPAYFGGYSNFNVISKFLDNFDNLFLIGRNGMHKYNNMDHSMLTGIAAAKNIMEGNSSKENIWNINTEKEYYESK